MNAHDRSNRASLELAFFQKPAFDAGADLFRPPQARRKLFWQLRDAAGTRPFRQARRRARPWPANTGAPLENAAFVALWAAGLVGIVLALAL